MYLNSAVASGPRYLCILGSASGSGKSTMCAGILAWLLAQGRRPEKLGYIKPMTQCIEKQSVTEFCEHTAIPCRGIGSLVFREGFTQDFIAGRTPGSKVLCSRVVEEINGIASGKEIVLIDGVGGPATGSVIGLSNVDIARALDSLVIFVGKPGIGAAIDDSVLCLSYMKSQGVRKVATIYNNLSEPAISKVKQYVVKRMTELLPDVRLPGFVCHNPTLEEQLQSGEVARIADWFSRHLDPDLLFKDEAAIRD
ncbi:MAG: dethiobiotin synthase [Gammaproteobacteria bacterium]